MQRLNLLLALILLPPALSLAQTPPSGGPYQIPKQVLATGGGSAVGGAFALTGTAGQSAVQTATGGSYALQGGFYQAASGTQAEQIFKNGFEN